MSTETPETPAAPTEEKPQTRQEVKDQLWRLAQKLQKMDSQKNSGARPRQPMERMLDATPLSDKDKDHYYRYENTDNAGKMQVMLDGGFETVPEDECRKAGVRSTVGELRLIRAPMAVFEEAVRRANELQTSRLKAHRTEVRQAVEAVARELRDKGYNIPIERLLVDE